VSADRPLLPDTIRSLCVFAERPMPLPVDFRPAWRLGLLLLILKICCRGGQSSLERLNVLNWAIRTQGARETFIAFLERRSTPEAILVRFEPGLSRAIDLALGEGLLVRKTTTAGSRLELTARGTGLADETNNHTDCLADEKSFLQRIKKDATEDRIRELLGWRLRG